MITVKVDGQPFPADISQLRTMGELIELVKATIDPETIVVSLLIDGKILSEEDWRVPLNARGVSVLEIGTGKQDAYLLERLRIADSYVTKILEEFNVAGNNYSAGAVNNANHQLVTAVGDLHAFIGWYVTLLGMDPARFAARRPEFDQTIAQLKIICDQLLQQQMFHLWPALGDTLRSQLGPQLEKLRSFCSSVL